MIGKTGVGAGVILAGATAMSGFGSSPGAVPAAVVAADTICTLEMAVTALPDHLYELAGIVRAHTDPNVFWVHNDAGGERDIYAIGQDGSFLGRVQVYDSYLEDWEDIEAGACADGSCLFILDSGDQTENWDLTIYSFPEPTPASGMVNATTHRAKFPDGVFESEALFMVDRDLYVITTGEHGPPSLYRYPSPLQTDQVVVLEKIREVFPQTGNRNDGVTSASTSPDGRWVAVLTGRTLSLFGAADLVGGGPAEPYVLDLRALGERPGDGVTIANDGTVWFTSEAPDAEDAPAWTRLACTLP